MGTLEQLAYRLAGPGGPLRAYLLAYDTAYVSGAYVPTYVGGTTAGTTTYAKQVGNYTRIGNLVTFAGWIAWTNATGTGAGRISLPFTAANVTDQRSTVALWTYQVTFPSGSPQALILPGTAYFDMWAPASNANSASIAVEAAGEVVFSGVFYTE